MSTSSHGNELPDILRRSDKLPSLPTVAVEVLRLSKDENARIEELSDVISVDPVLSAKILKLANSSHFRRGSEITTLSRATVLLGMKTVKLMALSFSLTNHLPRSGSLAEFDYVAYWRHSLHMAVTGRGLARLQRNRCSDEAFLCGLLGRIGQLTMANAIPERYSSVIRRAQSNLPPARVELEVLGYDHHDVGGALLESWQLPTLIHETVRRWSDPSRAPTDTIDGLGELCRIIQLSDLTSRVLCEADKATAFKRLHELGRQYFGLTEEEIDNFILGLPESMAEAAALLNVDIAGTATYEDVLEQAREQVLEISLSTAMDLQASATRTETLEREKEALRQEAATDGLTGIPNRAHFDSALQEVIQARLQGESESALGLVLLDIDHFKSINDTHGHMVGDGVLKVVARCISDKVRGTDLAARYGGEEFVAILPNTSLADLRIVAERIRCHLENTPFTIDGKELVVTASLGGACIRRIASQDDGERLLQLADQCLYDAKHSGRNRSVCKELRLESVT